MVTFLCVCLFEEKNDWLKKNPPHCTAFLLIRAFPGGGGPASGGSGSWTHRPGAGTLPSGSSQVVGLGRARGWLPTIKLLGWNPPPGWGGGGLKSPPPPPLVNLEEYASP